MHFRVLTNISERETKWRRQTSFFCNLAPEDDPFKGKRVC